MTRIQWLIVIVPALLAWFLTLVWKRRQLVDFFRAFLGFLVSNLKPVPYFWFLAAVLIGLGWFYHLTQDEAVTFVRFVDTGLLTTVSNYPYPNNQVLYSLVTNIAWKLFGWTDSLLVARLPAILFSLFTLSMAVNVFFRRNALMIALFLAFLFWSDSILVFSFQARSYSLQAFMAVTGLAAILRMEGFSPRRRFSALMLTNVLGMYASPSYLYAAVPLTLLFIVRESREILRSTGFMTLVLVASALSVFLLYSPIIFRNGIEVIISNRYVESQRDATATGILLHLSNMLPQLMFPLLKGYALPVFFLSVVLLARRYSLLILIIVPVLMALVLRQYPYPRVFNPISILVMVGALSCLVHLLPGADSSHRFTVPFTVLVAIASLIGFGERNRESSLRISNALRRIDPVVGENDTVYHWRLSRSFLYPLLAHAKVDGRRLVEVGDSLPVFPPNGILLTSQGLQGLQCIDSMRIPKDLIDLYMYRLR